MYKSGINAKHFVIFHGISTKLQILPELLPSSLPKEKKLDILPYKKNGNTI